MVAAADGEVGRWRRRALDRHLARCTTCRGDEARTGRILAALDALPFEHQVPGRLEQDVLRRVRVLASDEAEHRHPLDVTTWMRAFVPALGIGAVALLAYTVVRNPPPSGSSLRAGAPSRIVAEAPRAPARVAVRPPRTPLTGDPPPALAAQAELFIDLPILRNLEKLEYFDAIATTDGDDGANPPASDGPSNG